MNKIVFQIGLLAFFVATVVFGSQGAPVLDTISRAFVVFIGVVLALTGVISAGLVLARKPRDTQKEEPRAPVKPAHPAA